MKRIMIYFPENKLRPTGGQAGYLYNLRIGLEKAKSEDNLPVEICFYNNGSERVEDNDKLKRMVPKRLLDFRRVLKDVSLLRQRFPIDDSLFNYDVIHFHWTEELYLNRDFLEKYKGKVALTSHSPCVYNQERIERLRPSDYQLFKKKIDSLIEMDRYAFERADYLIFPCEEAEEPYYHTWDEYGVIRKPEKYRYMPTGIVGCTAKVSRAKIREKYHIPESAFVVSYVGRHNMIKGYGDLKEIGKVMLKDRNVYFLLAGKEEPMRGLQDDHWIEVGWTNDPHSLIAASDVFLLPNCETYFDLILLEVMSLGIPVALTETGGNKYFKRYSKKGMKYFNSISDGVRVLHEYQETEPDERNKWGKEIQELFESDFSVQPFARNYINIMREIVTDQ